MEKNTLNFSTPESEALLQKYKLLNYNPYSVSNLPNFASTSQNLLLRTQLGNNHYAPRYDENKTIIPIEREPLINAQHQKEKIVSKTEKIFDVIAIFEFLIGNIELKYPLV